MLAQYARATTVLTPKQHFTVPVLTVKERKKRKITPLGVVEEAS